MSGEAVESILPADAPTPTASPPAEPPRVPSAKQAKTEAAPSPAVEEDHPPPNTIWFFKQNETYSCFTNFYPSPVRFRGVVWPTSEHAFQAMKFEGSEQDMADVLAAATPKAAAAIGRDRSRPLRADWDAVRDQLMVDILMAKFEQNDDIRGVLTSTGTQHIVEHTARDNYWGDGGDGTGKNKLGLSLMQVRDVLRQRNVTDDLGTLEPVTMGHSTDGAPGVEAEAAPPPPEEPCKTEAAPPPTEVAADPEVSEGGGNSPLDNNPPLACSSGTSPATVSTEDAARATPPALPPPLAPRPPVEEEEEDVYTAPVRHGVMQLYSAAGHNDAAFDHMVAMQKAIAAMAEQQSANAMPDDVSAAVMAPLADATVVVVRHNRPMHDHAQIALSLSQRNEAAPETLGDVLAKAPARPPPTPSDSSSEATEESEEAEESEDAVEEDLEEAAEEEWEEEEEGCEDEPTVPPEEDIPSSVPSESSGEWDHAHILQVMTGKRKEQPTPTTMLPDGDRRKGYDVVAAPAPTARRRPPSSTSSSRSSRSRPNSSSSAGSTNS